MSLKPTGLEKVIEKGLCTLCGACIAACPRALLVPTSSDYGFVARNAYRFIRDYGCWSCGVCHDVCPITDFPAEEVEERFFGRKRKEGEELGVYRGYYFARSTNKDILAVAQDGGAVTSILAYAIKAKVIDCTLTTGISKDRPWNPQPVIARTVDKVISTAGSKYTPCPTLIGLKLASKFGENRVAVSGLPCHIWGIRKMQISEKCPALGNAVKFTIGIFCHSIFHHGRFMNFLRRQRIDLGNVSKFVISKGRFSVLLKGEKKMLEMPAIELAKRWKLDLECCLHCTDYLSEFADISVGGFGSPVGYSTVITRSEKGDRLFNEACESGFLECIKQNDVPSGMLKLAGLKRRKARKPYIPNRYERIFL
ncbi:MAG: Coenzyme F420 hydrogenase/dehydrogenase, beta subunit C-terminal domain [Candidatus Freyarchaeota archaeon]